mgnify:CR=1 FL=1
MVLGNPLLNRHCADIPSRPMDRCSLAELAGMVNHFIELIQVGLIQTLTFGAPVLFVKKKTGEFRMCVDYRALNKVTITNKYPVLRIDDLLDRMQGAEVFSSLDPLSAFYQNRSVDDNVVTFINLLWFILEYKVLPIGLTKTSSVFIAVMNDVLQGLKFCISISV